MVKCRYCGKDFRTAHNLENHQFLSHRDRARVTWEGDEEPAAKPAETKARKPAPPPPPPPDEDEDEDFWGGD